MLPAPSPHGPRLADVLASCLDAVAGRPNPLQLPAVRSAVVLLADGLGAEPLRAAAGHARTLVSAMGKRDVIESGFPTTTAAALASLTTGLPPGQHGLVGYSVLDPAHDRVVNQLTDWDDRMPPASWQDRPTIFDRAAAEGLRPVVVGIAKYAASGFTAAVLRGADYRPAGTIGERLRLAADLAREPGALVYVYVPELDQAGHELGVDSDRWRGWLETLDAAVRDTRLPDGVGMLLTADHGMLDIPPHGRILLEHRPQLLQGVRHVAGEPRCLQLHLQPGVDPDAVAATWREAEGRRAWVATRAEAIEAGWFGAVRPELRARIGEVLVAARKAVAYYDPATARTAAIDMVGQHGSWSSAELRVPLLRFGAFER